MITKVWLFPVMFVACSVLATYGGFLLGACLEHYPLQMAFISDGATLPPESSLFALFMNLAVFFRTLSDSRLSSVAATMYLRHRQIVEYYGHRLRMDTGIWRLGSTLLLWVGGFACTGILLAANFADVDDAFIHRLGATGGFFGGMLYMWGQVVIGYVMTPAMVEPRVSHLRLLLAVLATEFVVLLQVCVGSDFLIPPEAGPRPPRRNGIRWYTPDSPYYANHIVATTSEWLSIVFADIFILTFANELKFAYLRVPRLRFINEPGAEVEHEDMAPEQSSPIQHIMVY